jgi:hypothetical protein
LSVEQTNIYNDDMQSIHSLTALGSSFRVQIEDLVLTAGFALSLDTPANYHFSPILAL